MCVCATHWLKIIFIFVLWNGECVCASVWIEQMKCERFECLIGNTSKYRKLLTQLVSFWLRHKNDETLSIIAGNHLPFILNIYQMALSIKSIHFTCAPWLNSGFYNCHCLYNSLATRYTVEINLQVIDTQVTFGHNSLPWPEMKTFHIKINVFLTHLHSWSYKQPHSYINELLKHIN